MEEMSALLTRGTWDLVQLPEGVHPWVFVVKYYPYGSIDRYKAQLVSKGYTHLACKLKKLLLFEVES